MKMKVLLTGATGFLGEYMIQELLENDYEVVRICPVDMFPVTPHMEVVVLMTKGKIASILY